MEDFSVPKEFEEYSKALYDKDTISPREFVDFCLLAVNLVDSNWDMRTGLAYHIAGVIGTHEIIKKYDLLDQISGEFGSLELPDHHAAGTEEQVRQKWEEVKSLVAEADKKFPKS
ncbi:MAG TPA: hypothetical protein VH234_00850 [Candidatus Saccharimonadales bacterium]|jgi:hypothetical protein|nr:hypothetical protein [Candidatus Saccharimonadales bacterium]